MVVVPEKELWRLNIRTAVAMKKLHDPVGNFDSMENVYQHRKFVETA